MSTEAKQEEVKVTAPQGDAAAGAADTVISPAEAERLYQEELNKPDTQEARPEQKTAAASGPSAKAPEAKVEQQPTITDDDVKLLEEYGATKENATPKLVERLRKERQEREELARKLQVAEGDKKRAFSQNAELSKQFKTLKEKIDADPKTAVDAVRSMMKDMPLDQLPEGTRKLLADEDLQAAIAIVAAKMNRSRGDQAGIDPTAGAEPVPTTAPQMPMEEIKRRADEIESTVKAAHGDYAQVYGSPEFGEWFKTQPDSTKVKITVPSAKHHIELLTEFKNHRKAKAELAAEEAKKQAEMDALRGTGHIGSKGAGAQDNLSADDIMNMSDDEFKKLDRKVLAGGARR